MASRCSSWAPIAATCLALGAISFSHPGEAETADDARRPEDLRAVQEEIQRLRGEVEGLQGKERSVLEEIRHLDTEVRLRRAEEQGAAQRITLATRSIDEHTRRIASLEAAQAERRRYLSLRLREMYKLGPQATLRGLVDGQAAEDFLAGMRYAAYLSEKDHRTIAAFREDELRAESERAGLIEERKDLEAGREEAARARDALLDARVRKASYLRALQQDRRKSLDALRELEDAARELGGLADSLARGAPPPAREVDHLRGALDWPVAGRVVSGFGRTVHPQFKTAVPHPGLDIAAPEGTDIRASLEGKVVYSSWLRGYGLTAILEHAGGLMSVYAHAAALLVEVGEEVKRGQLLGKVGDTGSLRGPFLYFELRKDGKPVDPAPWLRRR